MKPFTISVAACSGGQAALATAALLLGSCLQPAHAELLQWEVTGRVRGVSDPDAIFGDVRLNDPVRGTFHYDPSLLPFDTLPGFALYEGEMGISGAVMIVENPRDQSELTFSVSASVSSGSDILPPYEVLVANDLFDDEIGETIDLVGVTYYVELPAGYQGSFPIVDFSFIGQDPLDDLALPTDLNLQDWPIAEIFFSDFFANEISPFGEIFAEILSIQLVDPNSIPGDFNGDRVVDGRDFLLWQLGGSPNPFSQFDLAAWEANYGMTAPLSAISAAVPEPSSLALLSLGGLLALRRVRRITSFTA